MPRAAVLPAPAPAWNVSAPRNVGLQVDALPAPTHCGGGSAARTKARAFPSRDRCGSLSWARRGWPTQPRGAPRGSEVGTVRPAPYTSRISVWLLGNWGLFRKKRQTALLGFPRGSQSLGCFAAPIEAETHAPAGFWAPPALLTLLLPEPSTVPPRSPLLLLRELAWLPEVRASEESATGPPRHPCRRGGGRFSGV